MSIRKRMWIDVDEVLNEYRLAVLDLSARVLGKVIDPMETSGTSWDVFEVFAPEEQEVLFDLVKGPGFCWGLPIRKGSQEAVTRLRSYVDLFVVTSPFHSRNWVYERDIWLEKHFGFKRNDVVHTSAKFRIDADICLDDKISNVVTWLEHHPKGMGMVWPTYHTRNMPVPEGLQVRDWDDVIDRVKSYAGY